MITSKSNQQQQHKNKKLLMFLSENREINAYLTNYLQNVNRIGDQESSIGLSTVLRGFCEVKTQFANEVNSDDNKLKLRYLIVRENTVNPSQKKIFIEFYKDESLGKLKFIIDTDFIEQIDFKEKENSVYLKRSETREKCQLKFDDKRVLQKWLNTLCRYCGFNEVEGRQSSNHRPHPHSHSHQKPQQPHNYTNIDQLTTTNSNSNLNLVTANGEYQNPPNRSKQNSSSSCSTTSSSKHGNFITNLIKTASVASSRSTRNEPVPSSKNIAGEAASSVGSFDLCSSELNTLFRIQQENGGRERAEGKKDGYLQLGEFSSRGDEDRPATSKSSSSSSNFPNSDANISNRKSPAAAAAASSDEKVVFQKNAKKTPMANNVYLNAGAENYFFNPSQLQNEPNKSTKNTTTSKNDDYYLNKSLKYVPLEVLSMPNDSTESSDINNNSNKNSHHSNTTSHSNRLVPDDGLDPSVRAAATAHKRLSNVSTRKEKNHVEHDSFYTQLEAVKTKAFKKTLANVNKPQ